MSEPTDDRETLVFVLEEVVTSLRLCAEALADVLADIPQPPAPRRRRPKRAVEHHQPVLHVLKGNAQSPPMSA